MNHAGEIAPLVKMVRPHVAIITTVEPVHLEFFPDRASPDTRQGRRSSPAWSRAAPRSSTATIQHFELLALLRASHAGVDRVSRLRRE